MLTNELFAKASPKANRIWRKRGSEVTQHARPPKDQPPAARRRFAPVEKDDAQQ